MITRCYLEITNVCNLNCVCAPRLCRRASESRICRLCFVINLLYRLLESSIGLRPPSNRIAFAARSDCVRRPIRLRSPSGQIASAIYSYKHRMYTLGTKSDCNTYCWLLRRPETSATAFCLYRQFIFYCLLLSICHSLPSRRICI